MKDPQINFKTVFNPMIEEGDTGSKTLLK
uniref:Uncharacterized protein n=1 Tax=Meloidogyne javanica TaxID=6303 RepID=A0A915LW27_MELJA